MYEEIVGVNLCGGRFENSTSLILFPNKDTTRLSLVYGKNGAGKSTLSRGISYATCQSGEGIQNAKLIDEHEREVILSENEKKNIFVFNEDFVDTNIKIKEDGIDTIVVLGNKQETEEKLAKAESDLHTEQIALENKEHELEAFNDKKNGKSPDYFHQRIRAMLKGAENWAGRDSKIDERVVATRVSENTYEKFVGIKPTEARDALMRLFDKKMEEISEARKGIKKIEREVRIEYTFDLDENKLIELLSKKIEKPVLTDREKFLVSLGTARARDIKAYYSVQSHNICPHCLQTVSDEYKSDLFYSIEKVLNENVKAHEDELNDCLMKKIVWEGHEVYLPIDKKLVNDCAEAITTFNNGIDAIEDCLMKKINDVYTPINISSKQLDKQFENICNLLNELEKKRIEYNDGASDTTIIKKELHRINDEIAAWDIRADYKSLRQSEKKQKLLLDEVERKKNKIDNLVKEIKSLRDDIRNVDVAVDKINHGLQYIFFDGNRLSIELKNGKYCLLSRNKPVSPKRISVGERNAIALCYFFSMIMKDKSPETMYSEEYVIVLDDPISSFDIDNRIGNLSYLKLQIAKLMKGNRETKVAVLTHDAQTLLDLEKLADDIHAECKNNGYSSIPKRTKWMKTLKLDSLEINSFDANQGEYTFLLNSIYRFANNQSDQDRYFMGNAMRRVLEAYGTFMYKIGPTQMLTDESVKKELGEDLFEYYGHVAYRLLLNGGSHLEDRVKTLEDINIIDFMSLEELKKTAKDVICLIYSINPEHIKKHLESDDSVIEVIDMWKEEIMTTLGEQNGV